MENNFSLNYPELGIDRENNRLAATVRNYKELSSYAKLNGFEDVLNKILAGHGVDPSKLDYKSIRDTQRLKMMLPKLRRGIDYAQIKLRDRIRASRKGFKPVVDKLTYQFLTQDGHIVKFTLDPDQRGQKTLQDFEHVVNNSPNGDDIVAQFLPTFHEIRNEMVSKWGWERKAAAPIATILTIKKLCDMWCV